ncbi:hypothetical protein [Streptomyces sp. NBC_01320]|uniref:hypothetical protein n=1 Tax=Streptomyces sp. NBC_01320 TaxID=2903824 RepID=UPI002E0F6029|nr:hypothetical protein OG395_03515 [Streptomyces sp. NBC_01320]
MKMTLRYAATTVLFAGLVLLLGAPAASAHGGPIKLEVTGDGSHDINVLVTWKKDGDPVSDLVEATLVATSTDGRSFGPVRLNSAPEGQNLYHSAQPLPSGQWRVTVTTTKPARAQATANVTARDIGAPKKAAALPDRGNPIGMALKIGVSAVVAAIGVAAWRRLVHRKRL